ncbi:MAG: DUF1499 domain-containing protein [Candidatus Binataceae bacterium]
MIPAWLSFFDAILTLVMVAVGILGAHFYLVVPFFGFQAFLLGFLLSIIAFILGVIGIFATRSPQRAAVRPRAIFGTVVALAIATPVILIFLGSHGYPPINDITTNIDDPPEFVHAAELNPGRDMKYDKARNAERQTAGYGRLEPLILRSAPDEAFEKVEAAAKEMPGWEIHEDRDKHTLEGFATSSLFHFQDDFVIRVRPAQDGSGSVIDMRSKSRDGIGDFGVNYKRIQAFFAKLNSKSGA